MGNCPHVRLSTSIGFGHFSPVPTWKSLNLFRSQPLLLVKKLLQCLFYGKPGLHSTAKEFQAQNLAPLQCLRKKREPKRWHWQVPSQPRETRGLTTTPRPARPGHAMELSLIKLRVAQATPRNFQIFRTLGRKASRKRLIRMVVRTTGRLLGWDPFWRAMLRGSGQG